jgi:hypothetical protein
MRARQAPISWRPTLKLSLTYGVGPIDRMARKSSNSQWGITGMDTFPDLGSLSDQELKDLAAPPSGDGRATNPGWTPRGAEQEASSAADGLGSQTPAQRRWVPRLPIQTHFR